MYKIQTLNKIDQEGLALFPGEKYLIANELADPDGIILRSFNMLDMDLPASLRAVARAGAGVNNIPIEKCTENGIVVFNTPGANANAVKELVLAGLLLSSRDVAGGISWVKTLAGKGAEVPKLIEDGKKNFGGQEILGKTLAVIGLGAIGVLVANAAQSLGMNVIGYDPYISVMQALKIDNRIKLSENIDTVLAGADYVTLNIPLTAETKGYVNKDKLRLMKSGVRIMNFARGGLVNNTDLAEAIAAGKVACYVTDFPDDEVLKIDKVIPIPHLGASTNESETNCAIMAADQMRNYLEHGNIVNSVNFPSAGMERHGGCRILIAGRNIQNKISLITSILAEEGINTGNFLNRNKGDIAYNIIDIDRKTLEESIENKIRAIDGIFMVRIIPAV